MHPAPNKTLNTYPLERLLSGINGGKTNEEAAAGSSKKLSSKLNNEQTQHPK